jgi:hydrolase
MEENGAMFTGDNILGHGTSVALEDLKTYMESLQIMTHDMRAGGLKIGYPGHGAMIEDLSASLRVYTRHWEMREKRVLAVFAEGNGMAMLTTREVTASIYGPGMDALAGPSVMHVLMKLHEEGTIESTVVGQEKKWFM